MTKSAIAIIQARMSSSRLPGKVLMSLSQKPMLWHIVERLKECKYVEKIIVATSEEKSDDPIEKFCKEQKILFSRGSLNNVFKRYINIIKKYNYPFFVRVTGDCPLISPSFIDKQIIALNAHKTDLIWLNQNTPLLVGQGAQSSSSLKKLENIIQTDEDKEHVASIYISNNPSEFKIIGMIPPDFYLNKDFRITVDEPEDYEMMKNLYQELWKNKPIEIEDAINWMNLNNSIIEVNKSVQDSLVNKKIKKKFKKWEKVVKQFCDWDNPEKIFKI